MYIPHAIQDSLGHMTKKLLLIAIYNQSLFRKEACRQTSMEIIFATLEAGHHFHCSSSLFITIKLKVWCTGQHFGLSIPGILVEGLPQPPHCFLNPLMPELAKTSQTILLVNGQPPGVNGLKS